MPLLQVHRLRELLLQHLLLEHEAAQAPDGGLQPELKAGLKGLAADCLLPVLAPLPSAEPLQARVLLIRPRGAAPDQRPLLAVAGIPRPRQRDQAAGFQALALTLAVPPAETAAEGVMQLRRLLERLALPGELVGVWAG